MANWEYKTIRIHTKGWKGGEFETEDIDKPLNKMGKDGWELVAAFDTNRSYGHTDDLVFVFKRFSG